MGSHYESARQEKKCQPTELRCFMLSSMKDYVLLNGIQLAIYLSYEHLRPKLRVLLTGHGVTIVTCNVKKRIATRFASCGHVFR